MPNLNNLLLLEYQFRRNSQQPTSKADLLGTESVFHHTAPHFCSMVSVRQHVAFYVCSWFAATAMQYEEK